MIFRGHLKSQMDARARREEGAKKSPATRLEIQLRRLARRNGGSKRGSGGRRYCFRLDPLGVQMMARWASRAEEIDGSKREREREREGDCRRLE
jgi:hypothetical protein